MADVGLAVRLWQREGVMVLRTARSDDAPAAGTPGGPAAHAGTVEAGTVEAGTVEAADAEAAADAMAQRAREIMGIARVCRAVRVAKEPEAAIAAAVAMMAGKTGSFAVRARRRDKRFPLTSTELATEVGTRVQQAYGYPVNLKHPDAEVFLEV